jgi:hypothetical protein
MVLRTGCLLVCMRHNHIILCVRVVLTSGVLTGHSLDTGWWLGRQPGQTVSARGTHEVRSAHEFETRHARVAARRTKYKAVQAIDRYGRHKK